MNTNTNTKLPKKITPCPIVEAVVEIRFKSKLPSEAIFGVIYNKISKDLPIVTNQPILQIPEAVRAQDPNLVYQAHYSLTKKGFPLAVTIGPRSINFINKNEYVGWEQFNLFIKKILEKIISADIFSEIERFGIRYINFFNTEILKSLNISVKMNNTEIDTEPTTLRTEISQGDFIKVIQITNKTPVNIDNRSHIGSLVDIDCIYLNSNKTYTNVDDFMKIISEGHELEKITFYGLLQKEYLDSFNPEF